MCRNGIGPEGAIAIAKALGLNQTLILLDMSANSIGPEGGTAMAKTLEVKSALRHVNLRSNRLGKETEERLRLVCTKRNHLKMLVDQ